nr:MAG TPA: hypothetical protein [Caudoviricetes sp.]
MRAALTPSRKTSLRENLCLSHIVGIYVPLIPLIIVDSINGYQYYQRLFYR